jgi:hypothetical protein
MIRAQMMSDKEGTNYFSMPADAIVDRSNMALVPRA